jgi:hypothetical protein
VSGLLRIPVKDVKRRAAGFMRLMPAKTAGNPRALLRDLHRAGPTRIAKT